MKKLKFNGSKNTQVVSFKVDPQTNQNLTALRNIYSKETKRRVTTGEIIKQLINIHYGEIKWGFGEKYIILLIERGDTLTLPLCTASIVAKTKWI